MRNRALLMGIYTAPLLAFSLATGAPVLSLAVLLAGALPGVFRSVPPVWRFLTEMLLVATAILSVRNLWADGAQIVMAAAALSISRAQRPSPDRAILGGLIIGAIATFARASAAWCLAAIAILAVLSLVTAGETNPATESQRTRLAATLAVVAASGAAAVGLLLMMLPWRALVAVIFTILAYPILTLLRHFKLHHLRPGNHPLGPGAALRFAGHSGAIRTPLFINVILIIVAIAVLAVILYAAYRYWSQNEHVLTDDENDAGIVRETLAVAETVDPWRRARTPLTPVRRYVRSQLSQAERQQKGRRSSETLREWLQRTRPDSMEESASTYEQIRYHDAPDTLEKRRELERRWRQP